MSAADRLASFNAQLRINRYKRAYRVRVAANRPMSRVWTLTFGQSMCVQIRLSPLPLIFPSAASQLRRRTKPCRRRALDRTTVTVVPVSSIPADVPDSVADLLQRIAAKNTTAWKGILRRYGAGPCPLLCARFGCRRPTHWMRCR